VKPRELNYGDVVQIDPEGDKRFGGCFMLVTEPRSWGAQGFCVSPATKGFYYYRCEFKNMEFIGPSVWTPPKKEEGK
jgi:hypothetical protein